MWFLSLTVALSFLASLLSSILVDKFLQGRIPLLGSFVGLELSHNPGVAFGMRLPPVAQELLIGLALVIVAWMAVRSTRLPQTRREPAVRSYALRPTPYALAYGLVLGGGLANIIDRVPDGLVTDYFQIGSFPIFNVADSCITIGVLVLLLEILVPCRRKL